MGDGGSVNADNNGADATGVAPYGLSHRAFSAENARLPPFLLSALNLFLRRVLKYRRY
jgi:hypothetical protein